MSPCQDCIRASGCIFVPAGPELASSPSSGHGKSLCSMLFLDTVTRCETLQCCALSSAANYIIVSTASTGVC